MNQKKESKEALSVEDAKGRLAAFEQEKMTRRSLLGRFGFRAAAAAVAAFTADDLLRAVSREMERRAGDSEVAHTVVREFREAGVAFASPSGGGGNCPGGCNCNETDPNKIKECCGGGTNAEGVSSGKWCKDNRGNQSCAQCCQSMLTGDGFCKDWADPAFAMDNCTDFCQ
ncbi:MAG: hypothetical protein OHK0029_30600 [Armatimonadaceae bacterium]